VRITVKKEKIEQGVIDMFKVNMGIKSGEKLAVVTDIPTAEEWIKKESKEIYEMIERSLLAKMVSEISKESFLDCNVEFYPYPSVGRVGGGKVGDKFREMLTFEKNEEPYIFRRNCAELNIGTNPNARRPDNVLESEKIRGTVHIAIGDSSHMGGKVTSDLHQDFVVPKPTMKFDGEVVMKEGKFIA